MGIYLDKIKKPNDIKNISVDELPELAREIRNYLVKTVSETGGHLASNLGAVELTMAIHKCLTFPADKLIWDVGHQAYVHKILTGRKEELKSQRSLGGISGFPSEYESECDAFNTGHSSTSISVAAGMSRARDILGEDYKVACVIGDGALSGGMAYEAINNLSGYKTNTIIILNDNEMSISRNVGGMATYLERARTSAAYLGFKGNVEKALGKTKLGTKVADGLLKAKNSVRNLITPGDFFRDMGLGYFGPIDGHNIHDLIQAFEAAKTYKGAVVVHVITTKGKGYSYAENNPSDFHGVSPFDVKTGEVKAKGGESYTKVFENIILDMAERNKRVVAITAAMAQGTGLESFSRKYPDRFFDVGIAEEHAVTFAAGMAKTGLIPVVCLYSTFLQRAYDQIIHDVCLTNKKVIFAIDRAGIVGNDGKTHQGIYDMAFLSTIPGLTILSPKDKNEMIQAFAFAEEFDGPIVIRYPRGEAYESGINDTPIEYGKAELIGGGHDVGIISVGTVFEEASRTAMDLETEDYSVTFFNARFVAPLDTAMLDAMLKHKAIVTVEEGSKAGGFSEKVATYLLEKGYKGKFKAFTIPTMFLEHGNPSQLKERLGLTPESMKKEIIKLIDEN